ncbi:hypothetical protein [Flagellimonas amoyensis]|uniref:hypothetical protein n=1 Tax=Flagellimonas amoyensis TaxID=2169401 RepID=UPI00131EFA8F|nr:hypothetical protein [Allomuricauda amoyensis]
MLNNMIRAVIIILLFQVPILMIGQNNGTFEIQGEKLDSTSNSELHAFTSKFNSWVDSLKNDPLSLGLKPERMVNNFILFSEDGLMMKDLKFHTVASCKNEIMANLPFTENKPGENNWIFVTLESQINRNQLIEILEFLKEMKIDYQFGKEDVFIPKIIGKQ